jgi:biotin synthase-like enzyme
MNRVLVQQLECDKRRSRFEHRFHFLGLHAKESVMNLISLCLLVNASTGVMSEQCEFRY